MYYRVEMKEGSKSSFVIIKAASEAEAKALAKLAYPKKQILKAKKA